MSQNSNSVDDSDNIIQTQDIESAQDQNTESDYSMTDSNIKLPYIPKQICSSSFGCLKKTFWRDSETEEDDISPKEVVEKSPKGRFQRFNEELGSGSQKKVYMCFDYDNGKECAWNVINVSLMNQEAIKKVREEIDIMKSLNHPNIISYIAGFYNDDKKELVIITEIFNGGSLRNHITKFGMQRLRVVKQWCTEILKGLKYLHELPNPIIHRDIKCDNIFIINTTGQVKIGDLGFSCMLKSTNFAKTFSGTIEFCAPEVFYGKYGVKADIYSFGMTMLEMITNETPYKECEGNILVICERATKQIMPESLSKIRNKKLKEFIMSCLKKEEERPSASDLLQSEFLKDLESDENNYPGLDYPIQSKIASISSFEKLLALSPYKKKKYKTESIKIDKGSLFTKTNSPPKMKNMSPPKTLLIKEKQNDRVKMILKEESNGGNIEEIKILLKYKKSETKKYNIVFGFNIVNDTVDGVANEMKKEINLTKGETEDVKMKLQKIINEYKISKSKEIEKYYSAFDSGLKSILQEAYQVIGSKNVDIPLNEKDEYQNKVNILTELIQLIKE